MIDKRRKMEQMETECDQWMKDEVLKKEQECNAVRATGEQARQGSSSFIKRYIIYYELIYDELFQMKLILIRSTQRRCHEIPSAKLLTSFIH